MLLSISSPTKRQFYWAIVRETTSHITSYLNFCYGLKSFMFSIILAFSSYFSSQNQYIFKIRLAKNYIFKETIYRKKWYVDLENWFIANLEHLTKNVMASPLSNMDEVLCKCIVRKYENILHFNTDSLAFVNCSLQVKLILLI